MIDEWSLYCRPLVWLLRDHSPDVQVSIISNLTETLKFFSSDKGLNYQLAPLVVAAVEDAASNSLNYDSLCPVIMRIYPALINRLMIAQVWQRFAES